jgi:hypothetical protein
MRLLLRLLTARQLPGGLVLVLVCVALAVAGGTEAATITVTSTADSGAGSLRDALAAASDGDTIQFDAALNGQTISLTSGELVVDKNIAISGPGSNLLTVSRSAQAANFRIFHVLIDQTVIIQGLTITGGYAYGGGIFNDNANLTITSCIIRDNVAPTTGGGVANSGSSPGGNATLTILDSTITGNRSELWGGGIYTAPASEFNSFATLTVTNSVVSYNQAVDPTFGYGSGGGIHVLGSYVTLNGSTVSHNIAGAVAGPTPGGDGGGIYCNAGIVTIGNSTIDNNRSGGRGGGISNINSDLFVNLYIINSSLFSNWALGKHSGPQQDAGGGAIFSNGWAVITNSTLSDNYAAASGGGIFNGRILRIIHSTLSGNGADKSGGGISNSYPSGFIRTLEVGEAILKTGSSGANIVNDGGTVTSLGYNLSNDDGAGFLTATGDQINTEPMLGPLQNNGGPTFTHELLTGSPAIDTGNPSFTPPPSNDQRGPPYQRVFNGRIDIGSLEVQPAPPTPTPTATPTPTPTASPTPAAQALNLSTRMHVGTGDNVGIGGFILAGSVPKRVLLRAVGPALAQFGIPNPLADPVMELHGPSGFVTIINDNCDPAFFGSPFCMPGSLDAVIVATLDPGAYTAIVKGKNNTTGVALVEVYDVDQGVDSKLANLSTRAFVGTAADIVIAGVLLAGNGLDRIVVRGIGPSLTNFGVTNALANPTLELRDENGALLAANDNWQDDPIGLVGPLSLAPTNLFESAIVAMLPPGAYTALLSGVNNGTGVGLVEVYDRVGQP